MNTYQHTLYNDLMNLVKDSEAFYFVDQKVGEKLFRVFSYRLASWTEFQKPNALECRGHTFEINQDGSLVRLASLPMEKFFNENEVLSHINTIEAKLKRAKIAYDNNQLSEKLYNTIKNRYKE